MNCCGGHEDHKEQKGKEHHEHQDGHAGSCGGSKTTYLIIGLIILLAVIFALRYFK